VAAQVRRTAIARHLISDLRSRARSSDVRDCAWICSTECRGQRFYAKLGSRIEEDIALMRLSVRA